MGGLFSTPDRAFSPAEAKGGADIVPMRTALLCIEFQNELNAARVCFLLSVNDPRVASRRRRGHELNVRG